MPATDRSDFRMAAWYAGLGTTLAVCSQLAFTQATQSQVIPQAMSEAAVHPIAAPVSLAQTPQAPNILPTDVTPIRVTQPFEFLPTDMRFRVLRKLPERLWFQSS